MTAFLIALLIVNIVLFFFLVRFISQSMKSDKTEGGAPARKKDDGELVYDTIMLQNDLKEFSDEVLSKIDQRMTSLRRLIKEADDNIKTLETMMGAREQAPPPPPPQASRPRPAIEPEAASEPSITPATGRRAIVMRLARKGLTIEQIAQEVGVGRGEIELILNVENNRRKS